MKTALDLAKEYASALRSSEECHKRGAGLKPRRGRSEAHYFKRSAEYLTKAEEVAEKLRSIVVEE